MILDDFPPVHEIGPDNPAVMFYENGDGEYWVPVEEEPDQRRAWMRCEATAGLALIPDGRVTSPVSACELDHHCREGWSCDAHEGCPDTPCPPAEDTDCWEFMNVADNDEYRAGVAFRWATP